MQSIVFEEANWLNLMKHYLVRNAENRDLLKVVHDICGLNAQGALTVNLSLWNRIESFDRRSLEDALYESRTLVKTWCMRGTVHIIPSIDLPIYIQALRENLMIHWQRFLRRKQKTLSKIERSKIKDRILKLLSEQTLTRREICEFLDMKSSEGKILVSRLLRELSYEGMVCHAKPIGPWYHFREYRFARIDYWLPDLCLESISPEEAKRKLLTWYLSSYGPASIQDFAYWTGFTVKEAKHILDSLEDGIVQVRINGLKGEFWLFERDFKLLEEKFSSYFSIHLLPPFDPLIMGYKDKTRILNPIYKRMVLLPLGDIAATILMNGRVIGTWKYRKGKKTPKFEVKLFKKLDNDEVELIKSEIDRMSRFLEVEKPKVKIYVVNQV